jgi:xanthine dehydrogenase accessory factor
VVQYDGHRLVHGLSPRYRLLLLGAGDVARYVAQMALALDYDVTLCDPRPAYLENWELPGVETVSDLPDDVVRERFSNPFSGIVALAHDPRVDDMALMEALKTDAFYIGAMGSDRTSAARRERLPELGLAAEEIARLHAPIGFPIGSKTPAEIAIAIMAEITAVRYGREEQARQTAAVAG